MSYFQKILKTYSIQSIVNAKTMKKVNYTYIHPRLDLQIIIKD